MKKISIVIPVYNVEQFIHECLESVATQTYHENLECLLIDDGSTDESANIIEEYINTYTGSIDFQLIRHKQNKGQAAARNTGLCYLTGDYVFFMDSDDTIEPTCIKQFVNVLKIYHDVDIIQSAMITMKGKNVFSTSEYPSYSNNKLWIKKKFLLPSGIPPGPCNRMMKMELLVKKNIYFHEGIIYEDVPFTYAIGQYAESIAFIKKATYRYRILRDGSTVTSSKEDKVFRSRLNVLNDLAETFNPEYPILQIRAIMLKYMLYQNIHSIECIKSYSSELLAFQNKLFNLMPWYYRLLAHIYAATPLSIRRWSVFDKIYRSLFSININ